MAKKSRSNETASVNDNIYDNTAKEITPLKVRTALADIIDSNFNLIDDYLKDANYSPGVTLEDKMSSTLWGSTGAFNVGGSGGSISGNSGIISTVTNTNLTGNDCEITINFNTNISDRKISVNVFTNSTATNTQNDIGAPVIRIASGTQIRVGLRQISESTQAIRLEVLAFKL